MQRSHPGYLRLTVGLACILSIFLGGNTSEAAGLTRPRITWNFAPGPVLVALRSGESTTVNFTVETNAVISDPKYVLQTPNGGRILRMSGPNLPGQFQVGNTIAGAFTVDVPPGYRAPRASARLYVSDQGSLLGPPLNIRVEVIHLTPEEIALTPVITPQSHIRMLRDRFDMREFTVVSETSLSWTNRDTRQHSVRGTLCLAGVRCLRSNPATVDPSALVPGAVCNSFLINAIDPTPCIDSGALNPQQNYTVTVRRPDPQTPIRYFMEDGLGVAASMTGYVVVK